MSVVVRNFALFYYYRNICRNLIICLDGSIVSYYTAASRELYFYITVTS